MEREPNGFFLASMWGLWALIKRRVNFQTCGCCTGGFVGGVLGLAAGNDPTPVFGAIFGVR